MARLARTPLLIPTDIGGVDISHCSEPADLMLANPLGCHSG
jgi:hypothetical protein